MPADPKPVRRKRPTSRRSALELAAATAWHRAVVAGGCRVCAAVGEKCDGVVEAHHVVRAQVIRRRYDELTNELRLTPAQRADVEIPVLWARANGMAVCYRAHRRHHNRVQPILRLLVPAAAITFAFAHGFDHVLERDYPT